MYCHGGYMIEAILKRKETHFVLWRPACTDPVPQLVIGTFQHGNPPHMIDENRFPLRQSEECPELWEMPAAECQLQDGQVYHYWFEVLDANPYEPYCNAPAVIRCTDPLAATVDWRLTADIPAAPYGDVDRDPPAVIKYQNGRLMTCDPGGEMPDWQGDASVSELPANNRLVIYELPTAWTRKGFVAGIEFGVGSFRDVQALVDENSSGANFSGMAAVAQGTAYLKELGINCLELLPPGDSFVDREWGYATSNYFAPDHDLGFPRGHLSPTANTDLVNLVKACHRNNIRFFADMVMAFATQYSYRNINFRDIHVQAGSGDAEEYTLDGGGTRIRRDSFGGDLFKYNHHGWGYDPVSGDMKDVYYARALMLTYLTRWMRDFRVDGLRLDSVVNYGNWDFMQQFKDHARQLWRERAAAAGLPGSAADDKFITVGEELAVPVELVKQQRLDGLWNENFKRMVRCAIRGRNDDKEPSFEMTVRKLIDCRLLGFDDGAQAVNYVTSHDVEGYGNERLYNFLANNKIIQPEKRIQLAFVCLLTAVGIPMILAGEEFADHHDLAVTHPQKQADPVNFDRSAEPWRREIMQYVARLVKLRTAHDALSVNDTSFIHVDFNDGKRVLVWQRGADAANPVVVVANFSDFESANAANGGEYVIASFPQTPAGRQWREVTQDRTVPPEWIGREPLYPWEAKVYVLAD